MSNLYSFSTEGSCPHCGKQLDELGTVKVVNGQATIWARVDDNGIVSTDDPSIGQETINVILKNPEPSITCFYCRFDLECEATEER